MLLSAFASAVAAELEPLTLDGDHATAEISRHVLVTTHYNAAISRANILRDIDRFSTVSAPRMNLGVEGAPLLVLLPVRNGTSEAASWIFTTKRHSVQYLSIYDISGDIPEVLFDGADKSAYAENIKRFIGFGAQIQLGPGETKLLAVETIVENTSSLPLQIWTHEGFLDLSFAQNTKFTFILSAILVIIAVNVIFFIAQREYLYLYLIGAELSLFALIAHSVNYVDVAGLARFPTVSLLVAEIVKCLFVAFMAQFARALLSTKDNFPRVDIVLRGVIAIGVALIGLWMISALIGADAKRLLRTVTWGFICVSSIGFPIIGLRAVKAFGAEYVPLFVGWCGFAAFGAYVLTMTFFFNDRGIPLAVTSMGVTGLFEAFFLTLALGWRIVKEKETHQRLVEEHAANLEEKLALSLKANELAEEKALATATIHDQNALLHASGHDTRQVLLAINNAAHYLERTHGDDDKMLVQTLKSSASYLNDILATTMSASSDYAADRRCVALSAFTAADLMQSLERIYRPLYKDKRLSFDVEIDVAGHILSDRALLMRALSNFMANSLKFTEQGGLRVRVAAEGEDLTIVLRDTGCGIEPDRLAQLNEGALARISPTAGAGGAQSGSGVNIARSIIGRLGGSMEIDSAVGAGAAVSIRAPMVAPRLTVVTLEELTTLGAVTLLDLDKDRSALDRRLEQGVGVTFDTSSQMRALGGECVDTMLYRPLHRELLDHPLLRDVK